MNKKVAEKIIRGSEMQLCNPNLIAGRYRTYNCTLSLPNNAQNYCLTIQAVEGESTDTTISMDMMLEGIKTHHKKVVSAIYEKGAVVISGICTATQGGLPGYINPIMDEVVDFLVNQRYLTGCCQCHKTDVPVDLYQIGDKYAFYCEDCFRNMVASLEESKEEKKHAKGNIFLGLLGALLGTIPGVILWVIFDNIGIIAGLSTLVMMTLATGLYIAFGKKMSVLGFVLTIVIGLVMVFMAQEIAYSVAIWKYYRQDYAITILDGFRALPYYLNNNTNIISSFYSELIYGYLFAIMGIAASFGMFRKNRGAYVARKVVIK